MSSTRQAVLLAKVERIGEDDEVLKKKTRNIILTFLISLFLIGGGAYRYLSDSYSPGEDAVVALNSTDEVQVEVKEEYTAFVPIEKIEKVGLIFYQGGKVEEDTYAPLLKKIAEEGIPSYLAKMPFNLAVLDSDAANQIIEEETEIKDWFLAGHSLGGAMAANYAGDHPDDLEGLILLAAYSSVDLSEEDLSVLSIYGKEDEVLNMEKYEENQSFIPQTEERIIEGGNHAQFGDYGKQNGDGKADISARSQLDESVQVIQRFIKEALQKSN